nr:zinc finger, CCHC-type, retrotransposon Gag domain protein [Tanacetum cinerariifolium]
MEKIFDVMSCEDAFKTRLAVYKFEGNALSWWKAYKQAKGGDAWLITVTWADFKKLFFLQFFPRAEQERLKREYHFIRQTSIETSTEFMQQCRRAAGTCIKCGQAGHLQKDCKKNTTASTSGQADKKPGTSDRVFAITEGHAANTAGFLATIHDMTSKIPSIHDQPIVSEFPDVFPDELPG